MHPPISQAGPWVQCSLASFLFLSLSFLVVLSSFPPTRSFLSPPSPPRSVFVPSLRCPASVVSLLVGFALLRVLLCALALLPARVGFGVLSPPLPPPFLSFVLHACCVLPLPVLCLCCFSLFPRCWLWLAVLLPSLLTRSCACYRSADCLASGFVGSDVFSTP